MLRTILLLAVLSCSGLLLLGRGQAADDISGKWHFVNQTQGGERESDAVFHLDGEQVTGKYSGADVKGTFSHGDLDLAFPFNSDEAGMTSTLKLKGKLKDGRLTGNWQFADYDGTFVATRVE
jgi:hypothetical protein